MNQTEAKIQEFFRSFPAMSFAPGEFIHQAGEPSEFFFYIESGAVKMKATSHQGQELTLHIFFPGACFSLLDLVHPTNQTSHYDYVTLLSSTIRKAPQNQVLSFMKEVPEVTHEFLLRSLRAMQGLLTRLEHRSFVPAYQQVGSLLLYFAKHFGQENSTQASGVTTLSVKITHQEIAQWLSLSRENVSLQMKRLEREGYLTRHHHHLEIMNLEKLRRFIDPYADSP